MTIEERIRKIISISKHTVAYSAVNIEDCAIDDYPILYKESIVHNAKKYYSNIADSITRDNILKVRTSGSSGIPLNIYWNKDDYLKSMHELWKRRNKYYGISAIDKKLSFNYASKGHSIYSIISNNIDFDKIVLYDEKYFNEVYETINCFQPKWIYIKPHLFKLLYHQLKKHNLNLPHSIKYIEFVGENIDSNEEDYYRNVLHVYIANMYGSEEMNGIAYECPHHRMHIIQENVFAEIQNIDNNEIQSYGNGMIILTNLHNRFMPLIRYYQGDCVNIEPLTEVCDCGSSDPIITQIHGRSNELFKFNNKIVSTALLCEIVNDTNYMLSYPIVQYVFIYHKMKKQLELILQLNNDFNNWKKVISETCIKNISARIGHIDILVKYEAISCNENNKLCLLKIED